MSDVNWRRYETLRPDELAEIVAEVPIAYWPLGLLEHHGWHLPVGFDGIKAERLCTACAAKTGGVVLPVMWWGAEGGHQDFLWTHYQPPEASAAIVCATVRQLIRFGFRAIILMAGHYPWQDILDHHLLPIAKKHDDVLLLWGTEMSICKPDIELPGDHAAREETNYGLALLPELVDLFALHPGRQPKDVWPGGDDSVAARVYPGVRTDANDALFSQLGEDARHANVAQGGQYVDALVEHVTKRINTFIAG